MKQNFPLISNVVNKLRDHESKMSGSISMRYLIVGARLCAEAINLYIEGDDTMLKNLEVPSMLDKAPEGIREAINGLKAMREAGPNPHLTMRLVSSSNPDRAWYPVEYDGEYKLWGYCSEKESPGLRIFYIQELPPDIRLDGGQSGTFYSDFCGDIKETHDGS